MSPKSCPPEGICLPVAYDHCRDGDTVVVKIPGSAFTWAVRLMDTWCPEKYTQQGYQARRFAEMTMERADPAGVRLFIPLPSSTNLLRDLLSFDRVLGYIFLDDKHTLNDLLVQRKHASSTKGGDLGV